MNSEQLKAKYDAAYDFGIPAEAYYYEDTDLLELVVIDGVEHFNDELDDDIRDLYESAFGFSAERLWRQ